MIIAFQTTQGTLQCYRWVQESEFHIIEKCSVCVYGGGGLCMWVWGCGEGVCMCVSACMCALCVHAVI